MIGGYHDSAGGGVAAFLAEADPCDPMLPPHVRLGALYSRARQGTLAEVAPKLLLNKVLADEGALELQLHAALLLARSGDFAGVRFLLNLRQNAVASQVAAVEMALRNCSYYPLAALAALSVPLPVAENAIQVPDEQIRSVDDIRALMKSLGKRGTLPGRSLGTGVVVQRPWIRNAGFRHTGFILVDGAADARLVPFDMGDLLNSDAADTIRAGSSVAAVYSSAPPFEVLVLYVLPVPGDLASSLEKAVLGTEGGQFGIVAAIEPEDHRYRIVTASGMNMTHLYAANQQELGGICILHAENRRDADTIRPLMMRRSKVSLRVRQQVLARFRQTGKVDYGVRSRVFSAKTGDQLHEILTCQGHSLVRQGPGTTNDVVYREANNKGRNVWFTFPDDKPSDHETFNVIAEWIAASPNGWGVALPAPRTGEKRRCVLVRSKDGHTQVRESQRGTLLSFSQSKGRTFVHELEYEVIDSCPQCFGSGHACCMTCGTEGEIVCPKCNGNRYIPCPNCGGRGKTPCGHCSGTGIRAGNVSCRTCSGTGLWDCDSCHGRCGAPCDCRNGRVACPTCRRRLVVRCSCERRAPRVIRRG